MSRARSAPPLERVVVAVDPPVTSGDQADDCGIVVAGVGDGNMTQPALDALADLAKKGVVVVRSSRVGSGIVKRNVEVDDDQLGFVAAMDLTP